VSPETRLDKRQGGFGPAIDEKPLFADNESRPILLHLGEMAFCQDRVDSKPGTKQGQSPPQRGR